MTYTIQDLATFSGVKAHTIRAWEKRYGILKPGRTETNIRYYDDDQLKRLLKVVTLLQNGYRISQVARLSDDELHAILMDLGSNGEQREGQYAYAINAIIQAGLTFDEALFEKTFGHCLLSYGLLDTYTHVILPVLSRTGLLWTVDNMDPCQEHFTSNLIRQKLYTAIDSVGQFADDGGSWVLFLDELEEHDIGLLFSNYLLRRFGAKVFYLGQRVPDTSLQTIVKTVKPDYLLTFITYTADVDSVQQKIKDLAAQHPDQHVYLSGHIMLRDSVILPANCRWFSSPAELISVITEEGVGRKEQGT